MSKIRSLDNSWLDTSVFREAGNHFMKYGYYTSDPWGSPAWFDYWERERDRCLNGLVVGKHRITGEHYFYLNYCPIQKVDIFNATGKRANKINGFPDFWDGDYDYFWSREIARNGIAEALRLPYEEQKRIDKLEDKEKEKVLWELYETLGMMFKPKDWHQLEGGKDLIIGKARRRGFSFKNASVAACNFFHRPGSYTILMAYEKKYLFPGNKTIFYKVKGYINFINEHTGWRMPSDYVNTQSHIRASYKENVEGIDVEKGFMSEIECISMKDNPDSARGADARDIIGEEVGAWGTPGGLKDTIAAMRSSTEGGMFKTGMMTLFGTSGDLEKGTVDFADLFQRPEANGFMAFFDIWGKFKEKVEGFFFPKNLNTEGFYDIQGNSDLVAAKQAEELVRENLKKKGATTTEIQKRLQEEPLDSSEAFGMISENIFPVLELQSQLDKVKALNLQELRGVPIKFSREDGRVKATPLLKFDANPITSFRDLPFDKSGCPIIYEYPVVDAPQGLYKIGYDPVRQEHGTSLAAMIVYKGVHRGTSTRNIIVAEYIGRLEDTENLDRIAEFFADFYNTQIMFENEVPGIRNFFRRIKRLNLLAAQPDKVISKNIKESKVARVYGCHMVAQLKDAGERYTNTWLREVQDFDENGNEITTIDRIFSIRLLEELIAYNRTGNFDLVSALFMCMIQVQEEEIGKEFESGKGSNKLLQLMEMTNNMYSRN